MSAAECVPCKTNISCSGPAEELFTYDIATATPADDAGCACISPLECTNAPELWTLYGDWIYATQGYVFVQSCAAGYPCSPVPIYIPPGDIPPIPIPYPPDDPPDPDDPNPPPPNPAYPLSILGCLGWITRTVPEGATVAQVMAIVASMQAEWAWQQAQCVGPPPNENPDPPLTPPETPKTTVCNTEQSATCTIPDFGGPTITIPANTYCFTVFSDDPDIIAKAQSYIDAMAFSEAQSQANAICYGEGIGLSWPYLQTPPEGSGRVGSASGKGACCTVMAEGRAIGAGFGYAQSNEIQNTSGGNWNCVFSIAGTQVSAAGAATAALRATVFTTGPDYPTWIWSPPPLIPPWVAPGNYQVSFVVPNLAKLYVRVDADATAAGANIGRVLATACLAIFPA